MNVEIIKMIDIPREIILKTLYKIDKDGGFSNIILDELIKQNRKILDEKDIGFISEIVYGTITWKLTIDEIIKKYSKIRLKKISPWILNVLRMGIYQIVFLDRIPKSAAVNESVNLAKRYGHKSSSNFVNAILRKVEKIDYEEFFNIGDEVERISKTTSMPIWMVKELLKSNTAETVLEICKCSNIRPKICLRVNKLKITEEELIKILEAKNILVEKGIVDPFLVVSNVKNIENLKEFKDGYFIVQDEAAGLTAKILNPKKGEYILDACSAPGGKTTFIAELMGNNGKIEAWDIYEHRLNLVNENTERLGIDIVETKIQDATILNENYIEKFDKILLDVPCLGIGVLKRKPDIKWTKTQEDIEEITKIQLQILNNCVKYLKKGGELVYSTCSIFESENIEVIDEFLKANCNFEIMNEEIKEEQYFQKYVRNDKYLQVYQNKDTDGFFIVKLKKK